MTDTDRETQAAINALVYRLRNRGDADDEPFAAEFITALRQRGWRPTEAKPLPAWKRPAGNSTAPNDEWRRRRAELEAHLADHGPEEAS